MLEGQILEFNSCILNLLSPCLKYSMVLSGFCMVLSVAAPYRVKSVNGEVKDTSYFSEKLHDNVLQAVLQRTYELFKV